MTQKLLKRKKTIALAFVVIGLGGLWIAGPLPPESSAYVQCVGSDSAVISKIDRDARRLSLRIEGEGLSAPVVVSEPAAAVVHHIRVGELRPDTRYSYWLEEDGVVVSAGTFRTAPLGDAAPVRFTAVGDTGDLPWWFNMHRIGWSRIRPALAWSQTPQQWHVARWMQRHDPHFFVHLGDIVYWRQLRDAHQEAFFRPFESLLKSTPIFTLVGNHDLHKDGSLSPFHEFFRNPGDEGVGQPQRNYSVAWGSVRIVALDVEDPECLSEARRAWFEQELTKAMEPWLLVTIHKPCFSVYRDENVRLRDELWPLLVKHGVDLVLSGDDHHFARYKPTVPGGPIQIVVGGGGKNLYEFDASDPRLAVSAKAFSYLSVEARGLQLTARAFSESADPIDTFTIDRSNGELGERIHAPRRQRIRKLRSRPPR